MGEIAKRKKVLLRAPISPIEHMDSFDFNQFPVVLSCV